MSALNGKEVGNNYEVTDTLKLQTDKLEKMLKEHTDGKPVKDWIIEDEEKLDGHLWENLKRRL